MQHVSLARLFSVFLLLSPPALLAASSFTLIYPSAPLDSFTSSFAMTVQNRTTMSGECRIQGVILVGAIARCGALEALAYVTGQ